MLKRHKELGTHVATLRLELAAYCEQDSVVLEKKREEMHKLRERARIYTEQIQSMVSWFKKLGPDAEAEVKALHFGDELDEEEGDLRDIEHL